MRHALAAVSLLLAGVTAGCAGGDGEDAPTTATEAEFCEAYNSLFAEGGLGDASDAQIIEEIRDWGRRLEETGTPESMSEEARGGFEETVDRLRSLEPDEGEQQLERLEEEAPDDVRRQMEAFDQFSLEACGSPLGGEGGPLP
jgi:hypothetical protein